MEREVESIAQKLLFICLRVVKNSHIFFALFCRVYIKEKFRYSPEKKNLSEWNFIRFNDLPLSLWPIDTMMMMTTLNLKLTLFFFVCLLFNVQHIQQVRIDFKSTRTHHQLSRCSGLVHVITPDQIKLEVEKIDFDSYIHFFFGSLLRV